MAGNTSMVKDAFVWPPIVEKRTCEWCSSPIWIRNQFKTLITSPWSQWPSDLLLDLQYCLDCVNEYHQIQDDFVAENPDKKKEIWSIDVERLSLWIKLALESIQRTGVLNKPEQNNSPFMNTKNDNPEQRLLVPVQEVLHSPLLLFNKPLADLFEKALIFLIDNGSPPVLSQRLSGLYVLLVYPSQKLSKWAERTMKGFHKLAKEDYDDFKNEVQWIVKVATVNMFELRILEEEQMSIISATCLPFHLFEEPFSYWRGFVRLLLSLNEEAIRHRLLGVSGHRDLPDTIINVIETAYGKDRATFWPAFNCFAIILESCGSQLWPMLSREPPEVLNIITNHAVYSKALLQYMMHSDGAASHSSSTDMGETQEFGLGSQGVPSGSLPRTALTWFQTFVLSILDFDDFTGQCASAIIQFLNKYSGNMDVKIKILTIVSTIMRSKKLTLLSQSTFNLWIPHVVELASLQEANTETFRSVVHPARELIVTLLIKSEHHPRVVSPIKSFNFNMLISHAERQKLIKTISSLFQKTEDHDFCPEFKRKMCARKSMRRPSLQICKQKQIEILPKTEEMREEQDTNDELKKKIQLNNLVKKEKIKEQDHSQESMRGHPPNSSTKIKLEKCTPTRDKKPEALSSHLSDQQLMFPKIELVDCIKHDPITMNKHFSSNSTRDSFHQHAGTKNQPILVDSDHEQEDHRTNTPQNIQDFSTFSQRSQEISRTRLEKISSPKVSLDKSICPSNMISKLSKSRQNNGDAVDDDDTSSLESNNEEFDFRYRKRKRRRLKVLDDSSDETESLEEEPLSTKYSSSVPKRSIGTVTSPKKYRESLRLEKTPSSSSTPKQTLSLNLKRRTFTDSSLKNDSSPDSSHKALPVLNRKVKREPHRTMFFSFDDKDRTKIISAEDKANQEHGSFEGVLKPKVEDWTWFEDKCPNTVPNRSPNHLKDQDKNSTSVHIKQEKQVKLLKDSNIHDPNLSISQKQADEISFEEELNEISEALSRDLEQHATAANNLMQKESDLYSESTTAKKLSENSTENILPEIIKKEPGEENYEDHNQEHYLTLEEVGKDYFGDTEDEDETVSTIDLNLSRILDEMDCKYGAIQDSEDENEDIGTNTGDKDFKNENNKVPDKVQLKHNIIKLGDSKVKLDGDEVKFKKCIQLEDDEIKWEDDEVNLENDEVLFKENIILEDDKGILDDDEIIWEDYKVSLEDDKVLLNDDKALLDDDKALLDDDEIIWEDDEVLLDVDKIKCEEDAVFGYKGAVDTVQNMNYKDDQCNFLENESIDSIDLDELDEIEEAVETKSKVQALWSNENTSTMWVKNEPLGFDDSQETARECVEADMKSESESESDDDVIEIFSCKRSAPSSFTPVKIKIEKLDDAPDVTSAEVQPEKWHELPADDIPFDDLPPEQLPCDELAGEIPPKQIPSDNVQEERSIVKSVPETIAQTQASSHVATTAASKSIFNLKAADIVPTVKYNDEHLISLILTWKCEWLHAEDRSQVPIYDYLRNMERLPQTFDSIDDYNYSFSRLLCVETWEQILKEWRDDRRRKKDSPCVINTVSMNRQFTIVKATYYNVPHHIVTHRLFPEDCELVIVSIDSCAFFGMIDTVEQDYVYTRQSSSSDNEDPHTCTVNIVFTIRTKPSIMLSSETRIELIFVTSLLTSLRQWSALVHFKKSLLVRDILRPRGLTYFCADEKPINVQGNEHYNHSQVRVIETATRAVQKAFTLPRISLVQGPPGTGKSHTIVGIVNRILNDLENQSSSPMESTSQLLPEKPRILICCPSNEGVDVLVRKLLSASIKKKNPGNVANDKRNRGAQYINCGDFSLVRVGRKSKIHDSVRHVSLENLTRQALVDAGHGPGQENTSSIKNQIRQIEKQIDSLEKENFLLRKGEPECEKDTQKSENLRKTSRLITQKQTLDREYRKQRDQTKQRKRMESRIKKEIINNADIVCSTLSGSGSPTLQNELKGTDGKKIPFSCVIVDEACQCCELDILIPLQFMSSKLILVGDPEQLPATVFSKDARQLLYERSMFSRLYKYFRGLPREERPVHLLDVQYRMHPEIALFPSKHVYQNNIHSDSSLIKRVFPIKTPYALFNVHGAKEINDRKGSIINPKEVDIVASLCNYLVPDYVQASDIGIITPYRTQLVHLQRELRDSGNLLKDIEVNTVDGFQGREKNIIIMSCVRSANDIGFLQYVNRLNVAITRARHTLFIFGNMDSLEKAGKIWKTLIDNAHHRKLIYEVSRIDDVKKAISVASSPYNLQCPEADSQGGRHSSTRQTHKDNRPPSKTQTKELHEPSFIAACNGNASSSTTVITENRSTSQNRAQSVSKENGFVRIPPKEIVPSTVSVAREYETSRTSSKTLSGENYSANKEIGLLTGEAMLYRKRKSSSEELNSPKKVRFGKTVVFEFDRSSSTLLSTNTSGTTIFENTGHCTSSSTKPETTKPSGMGHTSISILTTTSKHHPRTHCERFVPSTTPTSTSVSTRTSKETGSPLSSTIRTPMSMGYKSSSNGASLTSTVNSENLNSHRITPQSHTLTNKSTLNEVATRVREKTPRQRGPIEISPASYRGGRAGRVRYMSEDQINPPRGRGRHSSAYLDSSNTTQPPDELRNWHPHGGPKRRTAPHTTSSTQNLRSHGINANIVINRPPQKRASLQKNLEILQKKRRK